MLGLVSEMNHRDCLFTLLHFFASLLKINILAGVAVTVTIQIIVLVGRGIHNNRGGNGRRQQHRRESFQPSFGRYSVLLMGHGLCGQATTGNCTRTDSSNTANGSREHGKLVQRDEKYLWSEESEVWLGR